MIFTLRNAGIVVGSVNKFDKKWFSTSSLRYRYMKNWHRFQALKPKGNIPDSPVFWKQPERLPFNHPWKTFDFVTKNEPIDMTKHPDIIANSSALNNASDAVKRMFSFNFIGRKYAQKQISDDMVASVRNHDYDDFSLEANIARLTANIRNLNEHLETMPYDRPTRKYLNNAIFSRHNKLTELRECDYKRFEWLLEKLNLMYQPRQEEFIVYWREYCIRKVTDQYIEEYKARKLSEYKEVLESQKEEFLKQKIQTLTWIRKEEIECGIKQSSVTIEMIEEAKKQLEDHQEELRKKVVIEDKTANILIDS